MGSGQRLWKSINKYGKGQHRTEVLEHCTDRAALIKREAEIVTDDLLAQEACMNLMPGGSAGPEFKKPTTEEIRQKISLKTKEGWQKFKQDPERLAARNARVATPEIIAKRVKANTGKKRTAEQLTNLRAGQARYYASADPAILQERAQKAAVTRNERGSNRGGRPPGISMAIEQKQHLSTITMGKAWPRATCRGCGKETTLGALNRYHAMCRAADASTNRS